MIYYEIIIRSAFDRENFFYKAYLDLNSFVSVMTVISKTAVNSKWPLFQNGRCLKKTVIVHVLLRIKKLQKTQV